MNQTQIKEKYTSMYTNAIYLTVGTHWLKRPARGEGGEPTSRRSFLGGGGGGEERRANNNVKNNNYINSYYSFKIFRRF